MPDGPKGVNEGGRLRSRAIPPNPSNAQPSAHTAANGRSPTRLARNVSGHFLAIANLIMLFSTLWLPQLAFAVLRSATGHRLEEK